MATAFQTNAFQNNAFQMIAGGRVTPRGFDETLKIFAIQRRRNQEERDVEQFLALEMEIIIKALKPFVGPDDAS